MKNVPRASRKPVGYFYDVLSNPVVSNSLEQKQYHKAVASFVHNEQEHLFERRFQSLFLKPRFRSTFNAGAKRIEDFGRLPIMRSGVSPKRMAIIYKSFLSLHGPQISRFLLMQRLFESEFIRGNFVEADELLEKSKETCGESMWFIRSKITLLVQQGRVDDLARFSSDCKGRCPDPFIRLLINFFLVVGTNPLLQVRKQVMNTIRELSKGGLQPWGALLTLMFVPRPLMAPATLTKCFATIQVFPILDQAWLLDAFVGVAYAGISDSEDADPFKIQLLLKGIREDKDAVSGSDYASYASQLEIERNAMLEVVSLHEIGTPAGLDKVVSSSFKSAEGLFAIISLVAKAKAEGAHFPSTLDTPFWALVSILEQLYKLEAAPGKLEEEFLAKLISLHSFCSSPQLQLALYRSMPHRFPPSERRWLARLVKNRCSLSSPLSISLIEEEDPVLNYAYVHASHELAKHREIKYQIRQKRKILPTEDLEALLNDYELLAPLEKDHIELASACYLEAQNFDHLISFAAATLSRSPVAYTALPMLEIINHIEAANKPATLEAIVVVFTYVKRVDSQKEYLLNDLYEDYLDEQEVERPSALLDALGVQNPLAVVFFKDVSAQDTMDFLGCFNDSNDLRAERVRILDYLQGGDAISAEAHREEVDDIVGQVVIDSGATEFNVRKIDVNVAALKRQLVEDVTSLLTVYRAVAGDGEGEFLPFTDDEGEDVALRALVAGDKNTALLRAHHFVRDAFLFDEKYGLDKTLSAEIRHGFFSNLMRAKLEDAHLVTESDESGVYKKNEYWRQANSIVKEDVLSAIDQQLAWFSFAFDQLISQTEEWMKISRSPDDHPERVFNYALATDQFPALHLVATDASAEDFIDFCFLTFWSRTETCLEEIREMLNVTFSAAVDLLFDELVERLTSVKQSIPLVALMEVIVQTKNEIKEDIATVSEWFKRSESSAAVERSISDLMEISLECFSRVRGIALKTMLNIDVQVGQQRVASHHVKAFIVAMVNLLENCCRGSGFGAETLIHIDGRSTDRGWMLQISNALSVERLAACTADAIAGLDHRMRSPKSIALMRSEGGTGLSKVFNQLKLISEYFNVQIAVTNDRFEVRITYDY